MSKNRSGQTGAGFSRSFAAVLVTLAVLLSAGALLAVFAWQPWGGEVTSDREGMPGTSEDGDNAAGETPTPQSYYLEGSNTQLFFGPTSQS